MRAYTVRWRTPVVVDPHRLHEALPRSIEVKQYPAPAHVKRRIVSAFKRQADLDAAAVTTDGGIIKLGGKVKAWAERGVAERAAWSAPGGPRVEDNITIAL